MVRNSSHNYKIPPPFFKLQNLPKVSRPALHNFPQTRMRSLPTFISEALPSPEIPRAANHFSVCSENVGQQMSPKVSNLSLVKIKKLKKRQSPANLWTPPESHKYRWIKSLLVTDLS